VGRLSDGHDVQTATGDEAANINEILIHCCLKIRDTVSKQMKIKEERNSFRY